MNTQPNGRRRRFVSALILFCQLLAGPAAVLHAREHGSEVATGQVALEATGAGYNSHGPGCDMCRVNPPVSAATFLRGDRLTLPASTALTVFAEAPHFAALEPCLPPPARAPPAR